MSYILDIYYSNMDDTNRPIPLKDAYVPVKNMNGKDAKNLIAYFSRSGNNYVGGTIANLPVGNTEIVAKMIQEITGSDLVHIEAVHAYPEDYTETTELAKKELRTNARPKLRHHPENMASYDVIFLGYPNWWGTMPMPVFTFLEENDFAGKTIVPFCTHEGSGLGRSVSDIRKTCPKSTVLEGLAIRGGEVKKAQNEVSGWLRDAGLKN
jgi:flavodoxin